MVGAGRQAFDGQARQGLARPRAGQHQPRRVEPGGRHEVQHLILGAGEAAAGQRPGNRAAGDAIQRFGGGGQALVVEGDDGDGRKGLALHGAGGDELDLHRLSSMGGRGRTRAPPRPPRSAWRRLSPLLSDV